MKLLFICHNLTGGGAERVCSDVANGLAQRGHEVLIMTDLSSTITYEPLPQVKLIPLPKHCGRVKTRLVAYRQLCQVLREEKPDVVISILYLYASLAKLASMRTIGCPVIASDHNAFERPSSGKMRFRSKIDKFWTNYLLDGLTVLTEADSKYLNGRFKHTYVMPNPLGLKPLAEVPEKERVVLAVGRLNEWHCKGFDLLIKAWGGLGAAYPEWHLRIVGHGDKDTLDYLKGLSSGCRNIEFLPYTRSIQTEYQKADIFVLSSRYEGFGLVLTEAMSQGCACIACDYKGRQAEIVTDGKDGLLCLVDDGEALAQRLRMLLDDEPLRRKLQRNAIQDVDRFSIAHIAERWERVLQAYC